MYESYYGFSEKPFSLTPDPKYLYRSGSHANAFDLLQYSVRRREGFVVVTGDIGTGKTTLCRALLEQVDGATCTALVLNPFVTEEDLLKRILQDFAVVSRDEVKSGRFANATKQDLIDALYDYLLSLIPRKASAVLIIDEAQNLPLPALEQIRILSNLETDKEKLLQIILVGQLNLQTLLRSPELRQLDQRVSIRYELTPLDAEATAGYVAHRLAIAGGNASVTFAAKALAEVHRRSGGIPRLINLICDRALLTAYSVRATKVTRDMVAHAARSLDVHRPGGQGRSWLQPRASLVAAAALALFVSAVAVSATAFVYQRLASSLSASAAPSRPTTRVAARADRRFPAGAAFTVLVSSYPVVEETTPTDVATLTDWLESSGFAVFHAEVDLGSRGRWRRVLAGAYRDSETGRRAAERVKNVVPQSDARLISVSDAARAPAPSARAGAADAAAGTSGSEP